MQNKSHNTVYAGFFVRLAAYLIDLLIVGTALLVIKIPIWISTFASPDNILVKNIIFSYSIKDIVLYLLKVTYFVVLTYCTSSTLGKKLMHIKVISSENRKLTLSEVIFRESVGRFLSSIIIYIGYIMTGIDKDKRSLHDILSDTNVIYSHEKNVYVQSPVYHKNYNIAMPQNMQSDTTHEWQSPKSPQADATQEWQKPETSQSENQNKNKTTLSETE